MNYLGERVFVFLMGIGFFIFTSYLFLTTFNPKAIIGVGLGVWFMVCAFMPYPYPEHDVNNAEMTRAYLSVEQEVFHPELTIPEPKAYWKCKYCGQLNDMEDKSCVHCGSPRRIKEVK